MRTLRGLSRSAGRVYLYAGSAEAKALLCRALCAEGFTLGGEAPSPERLGDVMALNPEGTVTYPGFVGVMAFGCAKQLGDRPLLRVDAEKYLNGEAEYLK